MADKFLSQTGLEYLWSKIKALLDNKSTKGHTHTADSLSGTVPVSKGGTGADTAARALEALGAEAAANKTTDLSESSTDTQYPSAKAVFDSIQASQKIVIVENNDSANKVPLRNLASGTYMLRGYFTAYAGSSASFTFSNDTLVFVVYSSSTTYVQIPYAKNNVLQYLAITDDGYTRNDAKLGNMETTSNKVSDLAEGVTDDQYPSALAVRSFVEEKAPASYETWTFELADGTTVTKNVGVG